MAQNGEDLNKQQPKTEQVVKKPLVGTKPTGSSSAEVNKVVKNAKQSLTPKKSVLEKTDKSKKDVKIKGLTTYQEQALQEATKSKGNKKLLLILLLLLGFIVIVGVGVALFFILRPEEDNKNVVCEVTVLSYRVDRSSDPEEYFLLGSGDIFNFTKETQTTSSFTKDIEANINEITDFSMTYLVNNVTENAYSYTLNFSNFEISNCDVVVKINNGNAYTIDEALKVITISRLGDIVLEIKISGKNPPVYDGSNADELFDWAENTWCEGSISLTLEVE